MVPRGLAAISAECPKALCGGQTPAHGRAGRVATMDGWWHHGSNPTPNSFAKHPTPFDSAHSATYEALAFRRGSST